MGILYSMCWEDPEVLNDALDIKNEDKVLSITSGGENVFAILLKNPSKILAIDINKEQIYLTKLKIAAIINLNFCEFAQFLGFKDCKDRISLFNKVKEDLSDYELEYWNNNLKYIKNGIVHCGKLERYLSKFRRFMLPLIITKSNMNNFLQLNSLEKQEIFFKDRWNNWRFRFLFKLFFSKKGMKKGRKEDYFKYSEQEDLTNYYIERTKHGLTRIPIKSNFFMHHILTGTIPIPFKGHPYLDEENFNKLKSLIGKIEFINADLQDYLKKTKPESFSKYNLSDIFELKTKEEYNEILNEIVRTSDKNGIVCYWNNLAPRYKHNNIKGVYQDNNLSVELSKQDRCHFYSRFVVERVNEI
jgi:S-adenosylmethionine-diacylglycerol 3-amino-3-carboxypropyl transferase